MFERNEILRVAFNSYCSWSWYWFSWKTQIWPSSNDFPLDVISKKSVGGVWGSQQQQAKQNDERFSCYALIWHVHFIDFITEKVGGGLGREWVERGKPPFDIYFMSFIVVPSFETLTLGIKFSWYYALLHRLTAYYFNKLYFWEGNGIIRVLFQAGQVC